MATPLTDSLDWEWDDDHEALMVGFNGYELVVFEMDPSPFPYSAIASHDVRGDVNAGDHATVEEAKAAAIRATRLSLVT